MKRLTLGLSILLATSVAGADSWTFPKESTDKVYEYGKTKVVLTTDALENQKYPDYTLRIFNGGQLMAQYRNVAFEHLAAVDDDHLFIGVSNDGLPGTAIVVFDQDGNLRLELKHRMAHFDYCNESVTRVREWVSVNDPAFAMDKKTKEISFIDCRGKRVMLNEVLAKAFGGKK